MKTAQGWVQGFNAQAAANEIGVVIAGDVTQQGNDSWQCQPMIAATLASLEAAGVDEDVGIMLFDAGYLSDANLKAEGPDRLIATGKSHPL
ncbi:MAG: IS1182 family transposase, partial [Acidimicrobiales bacterium]